MDEVSVSEFKATCLRLIEQVRTTGQPLLITKNGRPAAVLHPPVAEARMEVRAGLLKGRVEILGDIVGPIASEDWEALK